MDIRKLADQLVDLCRKQRFVEAVHTLYADDVETRENTEPPTRGLPAVLRQNERWVHDHTTHSFDIPDYYVDGDTIVVEMVSDFTRKGSATKTHNEEIGVYKVRNNKIISARFYYGAS